MLTEDRPDAYDMGFQDGYLCRPLLQVHPEYFKGYEDGVSERIQDELANPTSDPEDPGHWEEDTWEEDTWEDWEDKTPFPISNEGEL